MGRWREHARHPGRCELPVPLRSRGLHQPHYPQQADEQSNVSRLFHTLGSVQMVDGCAKMANGKFERTLFTSGYSAKTKTYYMNTYDDPAIRSYAMADFDMDSSELITAE